MRNIRITLDDEDAELLDEVREKNNSTYRDLLLLSVKNKKGGK
jgi:hypothetical protein